MCKLGPDPTGRKEDDRLFPVDYGDNWPASRKPDQHRNGNSLIVHEGRYQAQERLVLRVQRPTSQKCADVEVGYPTARGHVRLVPDEHAISVRVPGTEATDLRWDCYKALAPRRGSYRPPRSSANPLRLELLRHDAAEIGLILEQNVAWTSRAVLPEIRVQRPTSEAALEPRQRSQSSKCHDTVGLFV